MPTPAKSASAQLEAVNNNVMVLIGRLLEATEASQVGLRTLDAEARSNSATTAAIKIVVESLSRNVQEIDSIVNGHQGSDSLASQVRALVAEADRLRQVAVGTSARLDGHDGRISTLERDKIEHTGTRQGSKLIIEVIGWIVLAGISLYAAIGQWVAGGNK